MVRFYLSALVTTIYGQEPKVIQYVSQIANFRMCVVAAMDPNGSPQKTWVLCFVEGDDLSPMDADGQIIDILEQLTDGVFATRAELIAWMRATPFASLASNVRNRIRNRLSNAGIDITGIDTDNLAQVVERALHVHEPNAVLEQFCR